MPITLLDGILVGFTLVSAMLAMVRGLSREILSIASWIAAAAAAYFFYPLVLPYVQPHIDNEQIAMVAAAGAVFVVALIIVISVWSRITRSTELRIRHVTYDAAADAILDRAARGPQPVRLIANKRQAGDWGEYWNKLNTIRSSHHMSFPGAIFVEVDITDASDFGTQEAWFYVTLLTIGYMVSRGLAKSGSRDFYDDDASARSRTGR